MASAKSNALVASPNPTALVPAGASAARDPDSRIRVLIVDNDPSHAEAMAESLGKVGYDCTMATSGPGGARLLEQEPFDIVVTDLMMNDLDGLEILNRAKAQSPDIEVILVTGHGTVPSAVTAMQQGAFNYLLKPLDLKQLRAVTDRAAQSIRLKQANTELKRRLDEKFGFEGLVGESPAMVELVGRLKRIAPTSVNVLIHGETGTGKELVAQAIHQNSPRKNKPFVALNGGAISEHILESELFGHVRGAFTDASADRVGKFEHAHNGTLFLDEVGDMPLATQIKLLRVLETGEITRVGSNELIKVNVRVLSATNRNLEAAIAAGAFREDLYHRLKVVAVRLPRLAERTQDIPLLFEHFLRQSVEKHKKQIRSVTPAVRRRLMAYLWPGNVRELRNAVDYMVIFDIDGTLDVDDLPDELAGQREALPAPTGEVGLGSLVGKPLSEMEKLFIAETLKMTGGNREEAAKLLEIGERTLYRKIKEYEL